MIARSIYRPATSLLLAACLACAGGGHEPPDDGAKSPEAVVVLLSNGHVLQGRVQQEGNTITIRTGDGGVVQLPSTEVLCWGDDRRALYRYRVDHRSGAGVDAFLDEAEWCLREGLLAEAAAELRAAYRSHPNDPRLPPFERRLRHAAQLRQAAARQADAAAAEPPPGASSDARSPAESPPNPSSPPDAPSDSQASEASRPTADSHSAEGVADADASAAAQQAISKHLVGRFTTRVQPLLINRCGQAACHGGPSGAQWQLTHLGLATRLPARLTGENLQGALRWIDLQEPDASPLLVQATSPHGGDGAPLGPGDADAVEELRGWIAALARPEGVGQPAVVAPAHYAAAASGTPAVVGIARWSAANAGGAVDVAARPETAGENTEPSASKSNHRGTATGAAAQRPRRLPPVADPFDPDVFNRMYHPQLAD